MTQQHRPMDSVRFIHRTLRHMLSGLEEAASHTDYANDKQINALIGQFQAVNFVLGTHIHDEDELIFPVLDQRAKNMVPNYTLDHRGDEEHLKKLSDLIMGLPKTPAPQRAAIGKQTYRESVALNATGALHMDKEEKVLYPLFNEHTSDDEQWEIMKTLYAKLPLEIFPQAAPGMMALLDQDEREEMLREFLIAMPRPSLKVLIEHAPKGMAPAEWRDLCQRIPALTKL